MDEFITKQRFVSAHQIQADFARVSKKASKDGTFVQILRHNTPQGVYLPQVLWDDFLSSMKDADGDYREAFVKTVFSSVKEKPTHTFKNAKSFLQELAN